MAKYAAPEMEIVEFENEDILTTSGCSCDNINAGGPTRPCSIHSSCTPEYGDPD